MMFWKSISCSEIIWSDVDSAIFLISFRLL